MASELSSVDINPPTDVSNQEKQTNFLGLTKKQRKKELKSIDYALKNSCSDETICEDKLIILFRKFNNLQDELQSSVSKLKQCDRRCQSVQGERDQLQNDYSRLILQKEKLESLCRELQKQNHLIKEESMSMAKSEDNKRREVADHFQTSIYEIQHQLNDYLEKNTALRNENQVLAEKLQSFINEHNKREAFVQKTLQTRKLEVELSEAKANQAKIKHEQEQLKSMQQIARLTEESNLMNDRMQKHKKVEEKLIEQIDFYKQKYQEFNKSMSNNTEIFQNAHKEMEKMKKHMRNAESQALEWREKWEASQKGLLDVVEDLTKEKSLNASLTRQVNKLSSLCRVLKAQIDGSDTIPDQKIQDSTPVLGDLAGDVQKDADQNSDTLETADVAEKSSLSN